MIDLKKAPLHEKRARIESRERHLRTGRQEGSAWSEWQVCEGTDGLTRVECHELVMAWRIDDKESFYWLRIEYRIIED
jgi:hypothetical protein